MSLKNNSTVLLGIGSNLGNRIGFLSNALNLIKMSDSLKLVDVSKVYETEPWGIKSQGFFLNIAVEITTSLSPLELLNHLSNIESEVGKKSTQKWLEREIDIDILFYGSIIFNSESLQIPHPEIPNRKFVLAPLCDLNPDFVHPVSGKTVKELLENTSDNSSLTILYNGI